MNGTAKPRLIIILAISHHVSPSIEGDDDTFVGCFNAEFQARCHCEPSNAFDLMLSSTKAGPAKKPTENFVVFSQVRFGSHPAMGPIEANEPHCFGSIL